MALTELECILQLVVASGRTIPVSTRLSYHSWDPHSVHIVFYTEGRTPVSWVFARDLLSEGTVRPSGLGDVRIWPGGAQEPGLLCLELSSPHGQALFTVPLDVVTSWLGRTYHLVPAGFEGASLDLDSELSRLLGEVA
ncbi:SsgA family sporulation/cell division regulator [Streptomyces sp. S1D4-11]|nr:SsgA family sporulation/cell division regulator [Streptomyces sp. S1D4-11]QIZ01001.1 SsgA family sporulation/cell division regulator [Streptomyces sp. S1D4-11]